MNATAFMEELGGLYGSRVMEEFGEIIRLYDFYEGKGQLWPVNGTLDYLPTVKRTNLIKKLIKAQARFLFGRTPEFSVRAMEKENTQAAQEMTRFLNRILRENHFGDRLIRAARDCFIGKRVALRLWTDEDGLSIGFRPSLEFLYEPKEDDADKLAKIVFFYQLNTEPTHRKQRIWKQKFVMEQGRCLLSEGIYDGEELEQEMMVMAGLSSGRIDAVISALRRTGVGRINYKAVLTPTNSQWDSLTLYRELAREHAAMSGKTTL